MFLACLAFSSTQECHYNPDVDRAYSCCLSSINLVAFSAFNGDLSGQVFSLFILTVAAAEAAIGLAILVVYFRNRGSISVDDINVMKG